MNKKSKIFNIILAMILMLITLSTTVLAANEDITLEKVKEDICTIQLGEDGEVIKKLVSVDNENKEVTLQIDVNTEETIVNSEVFLVIDNSASMTENNLEDGRTRKEAVFTAAKTLARKMLQTQSSMKIGIVSFSTNSDISKEGTYEDANYVLAPTENINEITAAIDSIEATGKRTNIDAGLQVAKNNFTKTTELNQYLILLTDGVPNTAVGGPTMTYSGEVKTKTKNTLQSILNEGINIITVMTGVNSEYKPDADGMLSSEAANKTYKDLAEEIFGTQEEPNYGIFYYVTDENVEDTITENVYSNVAKLKENKLKNITIIDYFPENIIANYDFEIVEKANIGEVTEVVDTTNNSIIWTIETLELGKNASFKYKLKLKKDFDENIINVETPTNQRVDVIYTGTDNIERTETSDIGPSVILTKTADNTIAPDPIPQTGDSTFAVIAGVIALVIIVGISIRKYNK